MQVLKDYISFNADALKLRERRNMIIGSNIANAATPGFKARDIDFRSALEQAKTSLAQLNMTNTRHMPLSGSAEQPTVMFRQPLQESTNGNTVDAQSEHAAFMENAMRYQASLQLLDNRIKGIKNAIKGEA